MSKQALVSKNENDSRLALSIILPAYNEGKNIRERIKNVRSVLERLGLPYEIIIVDDGSIDETRAEANGEITNGKISVIGYDRNMGKGHALKHGFQNSSGDFVIFLDGDSDIDPSRLGTYISALAEADVVIASKRHPFSRIESSFERKFLSHAFHAIVKILTGVRVSDTQAGLKAFRRNALIRTFPLVLVKKFAFDVELLCVASILQLRIREMPVTISLDNRFSLKEISRLVLDVLAVAYRHRLRRWYHKKLFESGIRAKPTGFYDR